MIFLLLLSNSHIIYIYNINAHAIYTSQLQLIYEQSCTYCFINIILQISTDYHIPHSLINIMLPPQGTIEILSYPLLDT